MEDGIWGILKNEIGKEAIGLKGARRVRGICRG
jgi:hypothetical protein